MCKLYHPQYTLYVYTFMYIYYTQKNHTCSFSVCNVRRESYLTCKLNKYFLKKKVNNKCVHISWLLCCVHMFSTAEKRCLHHCTWMTKSTPYFTINRESKNIYNHLTLSIKIGRLRHKKNRQILNRSMSLKLLQQFIQLKTRWRLQWKTMR